MYARNEEMVSTYHPSTFRIKAQIYADFFTQLSLSIDIELITDQEALIKVDLWGCFLLLKNLGDQRN